MSRRAHHHQATVREVLPPHPVLILSSLLLSLSNNTSTSGCGHPGPQALLHQQGQGRGGSAAAPSPSSRHPSCHTFACVVSTVQTQPFKHCAYSGSRATFQKNSPSLLLKMEGSSPISRRLPWCAPTQCLSFSRGVVQPDTGRGALCKGNSNQRCIASSF